MSKVAVTRLAKFAEGLFVVCIVALVSLAVITPVNGLAWQNGAKVETYEREITSEKIRED